MLSDIVAQDSPPSNPQQIIEAVQPEFKVLAQHHNSVQWEAEANYAVQQLYKSDFAAKTAVRNPVSVQNAVRNIAAIGLTLNPALKYAYLVPRDGQICLDVSYMGLMHLAQDTGSVVWAQCKLVHQNDNYTNRGATVEPEHTYSAFSDRGPILGAYCVVKLADGDFMTHEMPIGDIYAIRDRSMAWKSFKAGKAKSGGPWHTDEKEMIKKTVVKQASKYWPKVERMQEAVEMINQESGEGIDFEAERQEASEHYQWAQLLVGYMSNEDSEALFDEYMSVSVRDGEFVEKAWKHLSAPDRRNIKKMLSEEKENRVIENQSEEN